MGVFDAMASNGSHEQVVFCEDRRAGLKAIIAIHDTTLGPALGGTRMWPYKNEEEALRDVLRLSRGMTYKAAAAGLNLGGGKAVIIGDPRTDKSEALFRLFGRFVESLNGRYITAEDVGTSVHDMEYITALGVFQAMKAALKSTYSSESFAGKRVALQGLGNVGRSLLESLVKAGAKVTVTDIDEERCERARREHGVEVVGPEAIYDVACDVFSPNALGAILNDQTIPRLKCKIICGGANNQLAEERHAKVLTDKGMLYCPDYVVNAGGLINVYVEMEGYVRDRALRMAEGIYGNLERVIKIAKEQGVTTAEAADRFAEQRIDKIGDVKRGFFGGI
jgi:leucine dehydrogenase